MEMDSVKVSVVVPVYNAAEYLPYCLDSLLGQTLEGLEVIVVNDGSMDSSGDILESYGKVWSGLTIVHQKHAGQGMARNAGVERAVGECIGFVDADDYVENTMYEYLYRAISEHGVDMAVCKAFTVDALGQDVQKLKLWGTLPSGIYQNGDLLKTDFFNTGCSPVVWDKLFCRKLVEKNPALGIPRGQDFVALIDYVYKAEKIEITEDYLYYYRHHANSVMAQPVSLEVCINDLWAEKYAARKIVGYYSGWPVADHYMEKMLRDWEVRVEYIRKRVDASELLTRLSIFVEKEFSFLDSCQEEVIERFKKLFIQ